MEDDIRFRGVFDKVIWKFSCPGINLFDKRFQHLFGAILNELGSCHRESLLTLDQILSNLCHPDVHACYQCILHSHL
jgi:hypothetical protein